MKKYMEITWYGLGIQQVLAVIIIFIHWSLDIVKETRPIASPFLEAE